MPFSRTTGRVLSCMVLALAFLSVPGCRRTATRAAASGPIVLNFWNGFTGPDGRTMERIIHQFNREHKDIRVKMQIIPWSTYYDKVTLGLAYGGAPDVFILHQERLAEYADAGALSRIDDLISEGGLDPKDFMPIPWQAGFWRDKQYAVPLDCHPIGLFYNTELFEKAGIVDKRGKAKPPTNLKEFIEAGRKLTIDRNRDGRPEQWGYVFGWLRVDAHSFLAQYNTLWLTPDGKRADIDSPAAHEAFRMMRSLIKDRRICPSPEGVDAWIGFRTGKVAMTTAGIFMLSDLERQEGLKYAGAECPMLGKRKAVWANSHMLAMPAKLDARRRKAGWEFIRYLSDHSLEWSKGGQLPVRKSVLASPEFRKLRVQYEFAKELPYVVYQPPSTAMTQILPFCDAASEGILIGIKPVDEGLAECARRINGVLERQ